MFPIIDTFTLSIIQEHPSFSLNHLRSLFKELIFILGHPLNSYPALGIQCPIFQYFSFIISYMFSLFFLDVISLVLVRLFASFLLDWFIKSIPHFFRDYLRSSFKESIFILGDPPIYNLLWAYSARIIEYVIFIISLSCSLHPQPRVVNHV